MTSHRPPIIVIVITGVIVSTGHHHENNRPVVSSCSLRIGIFFSSHPLCSSARSPRWIKRIFNEYKYITCVNENHRYNITNGKIKNIYIYMRVYIYIYIYIRTYKKRTSNKQFVHVKPCEIHNESDGSLSRALSPLFPLFHAGISWTIIN